MKDGIIKNDGTSRFLSGYFPETYDEFRDLAREKKLPVDILYNESGWLQAPDFLNKVNLLSSDTTSAYEIPDASVVNDAFMAALSPYKGKLITRYFRSSDDPQHVYLDKELFSAKKRYVVTVSSPKESGRATASIQSVGTTNAATVYIEPRTGAGDTIKRITGQCVVSKNSLLPLIVTLEFFNINNVLDENFNSVSMFGLGIPGTNGLCIGYASNFTNIAVYFSGTNPGGGDVLSVYELSI